MRGRGGVDRSVVEVHELLDALGDLGLASPLLIRADVRARVVIVRTPSPPVTMHAEDTV